MVLALENKSKEEGQNEQVGNRFAILGPFQRSLGMCSVRNASHVSSSYIWFCVVILVLYVCVSCACLRVSHVR